MGRFQIRGDEPQNIDDMVLERELRHSVARRRARLRERDPFFDDGGLVLPNEIGQTLMSIVIARSVHAGVALMFECPPTLANYQVLRQSPWERNFLKSSRP